MIIFDDPRRFPAAPAQSFDWAALMIEPMQGSGERFVFAVAAAGPDDFCVLPTVAERVIRCMYGESAASMSGLIEVAIEAMQDHLRDGVPLTEWESPFAGCFIGEVRKTLAEDVKQAALLGAKLVASLMSQEVTQAANATHRGRQKFDVDAWVAQIREQVVAHAPTWRERFNRDVNVLDGALPTKVGYIGERMSASFEILDPGNITPRRHRAKSRLLDLQNLRDHDGFFPKHSYELLLWLPPGGRNIDNRGDDPSEAVLLELKDFGGRHDIQVVGVDSAEAAAKRMVATESA